MVRLTIVFFALVILAGCKKSLSDKYAFNINGVAYNGNDYTATYHYDSVAALQEFATEFYIGNVADTNYVEISFSGNHYITAGNYYTGIINPGNTVCSFAYNKRNSYYTNITGILQVTQIDTVGHILKGSFQFKAINNSNPADSVLVTNGGFSGIQYAIE